MKSFKPALTFLLTGLLLIAASTICLAAESKILGIPWGASEDEAAHIMSERPKTRCQLFAKNGVEKWKGCYTTFNDENVFVELHFYQGKMYYVAVLSYAGEDQVMGKFNSFKQGMSVRYGAPSSEKGKYLGSNVWWDLGSGYWARLLISKNNNKPNLWPESQIFSFPFAIQLNYYHHETDIIVHKVSGTTSGKDF